MVETMRAWTFTARGKPSEVLKLRDDLPKPKADSLAPDEVLVKVSHVAVVQGFVARMVTIPHFTSNPWIPDFAFSGLIEAVGSQVDRLKQGDPVFGCPDPKKYLTSKYNGMLVEYAILPASRVVRKPDSISFEAAAGLPASGSTGVQFARLSGLKEGQTVLVTAASGTVGTAVVQVVRSMVGKQGRVIGTCSAANEQLVKDIGADEVIDYRSHPQMSDYLTEKHSSDPFDVIIDLAGTDNMMYDKSPAYLKPDGTYLLGGKMSATHGGAGIRELLPFLLSFQLKTRWPLMLGGTPRKGMFVLAPITLESMQEIARLVERGQLKGLVDSEWPMEQALQAYERVGTSRARGAVVVHVQDV